jgi:hypothetical protein
VEGDQYAGSKKVDGNISTSRMIKRLLVTLLPFLGSSCREQSAHDDKVQMLDPKQILFSLATLCDPAPAVEAKPIPAGARQLHEDDWRQIEFVPASNRDYIEKELERLAAFQREHRRGMGWDSVYVRKEHPTPFATVGVRFADLPPLLASDLALGGHPVRGGFALSAGDGCFIYGQRTGEGGVLHLAISPGGTACSREFARAVVQIAERSHLLLVNWYAGAVVDTSSIESVLASCQR